MAAGVVVGGGLGAFYFGYDKAVGSPLRVGVIGTGDEGSVLLGAINPEFIEVKSIADIRPYNVWRAFHGDHSSDDGAGRPARPDGQVRLEDRGRGPPARQGLRPRERRLRGADQATPRHDGIEAVIIALPLHLHAPAAIAAMKAGLHVLTEKLMAHSVHECKDMARVAEQTGLLLATGHQRHYNILYANAVDSIQRGVLGDLHYIRAQWNRGNLPGKDSWQQPLPPEVKPDDPLAKELLKKREGVSEGIGRRPRGAAIDVWRTRLAQVEAQMADKIVDAEKFGYETHADQGRLGQGGLRPAGDRGVDPLAALGPHRRRA